MRAYASKALDTDGTHFCEVKPPAVSGGLSLIASKTSQQLHPLYPKSHVRGMPSGKTELANNQKTCEAQYQTLHYLAEVQEGISGFANSVKFSTRTQRGQERRNLHAVRKTDEVRA